MKFDCLLTDVPFVRVAILCRTRSQAEEVKKLWNIPRSESRIEYPNGATAWVTSVASIDEAYYLAGCQFTHIYVDKGVPSEALPFLRSRLRSAQYRGELVMEEASVDRRILGRVG